MKKIHCLFVVLGLAACSPAGDVKGAERVLTGCLEQRSYQVHATVSGWVTDIFHPVGMDIATGEAIMQLQNDALLFEFEAAEVQVPAIAARVAYLENPDQETVKR